MSVKLDISQNRKAWIYVDTMKVCKQYEEGEHMYFVKIPKGTSYVETQEEHVVMYETVIIIGKNDY